MGVGGGRRRGRRTGQEIGGGGLAQIGEMGVSQKGVVHLEVGEGMVSRGWGGDGFSCIGEAWDGSTRM